LRGDVGWSFPGGFFCRYAITERVRF